MIEINISSDIKRLQRRLNDIERNQLPFALALALTGVAFDIRKETVERVGPRSFELRDPRFLRAAIRVEKATKHNLTARVYDHLESSDLEAHARGKVKQPVVGRHIAVPTKVLTPKRRARGVPKAWRPKQVMRKPRVFMAEWRGRKYIWRRRTKKRYPIEPLYLLVSSAKMPKSFPFYSAARATFRGNIGHQMEKALRRAVRTRKK